MKKFVDLTAFISQLPHGGNQAQWPENIELKVSGKYDGDKVLLHTMKYRAVFSIEGYNYTAYSIEQLSAQIVAWLGTNDDREELDDPMPGIDADILDDLTADIEITVEFEEDVYITPHEEGEIEYGGRRWRLENREHDIAETASVVSKDE